MLFFRDLTAHLDGSAPSTFESNSAQYGGAVAFEGQGLIKMASATFTSNRATIEGGAIFATISDVADGFAGLTVDSTHFERNSAPLGGALYLYILSPQLRQLKLTRSQFVSNRAEHDGSAIFVDAAADIVWSGYPSFFSGNSVLLSENHAGTADQAGGGAIFWQRQFPNEKDFTPSIFNFAANQGGYGADFATGELLQFAAWSGVLSA